MYTNDTHNAVLNALNVIVQTPLIRQTLDAIDPMALKQVEDALAADAEAKASGALPCSVDDLVAGKIERALNARTDSLTIRLAEVEAMIGDKIEEAIDTFNDSSDLQSTIDDRISDARDDRNDDGSVQASDVEDLD